MSNPDLPKAIAIKGVTVTDEEKKEKRENREWVADREERMKIQTHRYELLMALLICGFLAATALGMTYIIVHK